MEDIPGILSEEEKQEDWYLEMKAEDEKAEAEREARESRRDECKLNLSQEDLSPEQDRAVLLMAQGCSFKEVADELGISVSKLYRWRQSNDFQFIVNTMKTDLKQVNKDAIHKAVTKSITTLTELLDDEDSKVRHSAARTVLMLFKEK